MTGKEKQDHLQEYDTEYRWLAKYYKLEFDDFIENAKNDSYYPVLVKIMRQYNYDQNHE